MQPVPSTPTTKHHHRIVPVSLIALGLPIALAVGFLVVVNAVFHDEPMPDDSSLRLPDVAVVEADNAYADVLKLGKDFTAADPNAGQPYEDAKVDQMLNGGAWDEARATEVLNTYSVAIADFHAAAKKDFYQDPYAAHPSTVTFENLYLTDIGTVRSTGKLIALESLRKAKNGDINGGLDEAIEVVKLAHMFESDQPTLIGWLVGSATKQIGLSAVRQIAVQSGLTVTQSNKAAQLIEQYRGSLDGLVKVMKLEYAYYKAYPSIYEHLGALYDQYYVSSPDSTYRSATGKFISLLDDIGVTKFYFWPHQNRRFVIENHQEMVAIAQSDCATGDLGERMMPQRSHRTGFGRLLEPNAVGKMLADIGRISYGGIVGKRCNEELAISATQAALAISAFQHDKHQLPDTLVALVPAYLPAVTTDPYSGQSLQYNKEKKIIYSVGQDRLDEQGNMNKVNSYSTSGGEWQNMYDPTFVVAQ